MSQTRKHSAIESVANVGIGYAVALGTQLVIFPAYGVAASMSEHMTIGAAFTAVSLARSYTLRRLFNRAQEVSA